MAIWDVVTLGFGQTEIYYVTLLGFTFNPAPPVITPGKGPLVTLPERTLTVSLKPGGRTP